MGRFVSIFGETLPETNEDLLPLAHVRGEEFLYSFSNLSNRLRLFWFRRDKEIHGPEEILNADVLIHDKSWTEKALSKYIALPLLACGLKNSQVFTALYHMDSNRITNCDLNEKNGLTMNEAKTISSFFKSIRAFQSNNSFNYALRFDHEKNLLCLNFGAPVLGTDSIYIPKNGNLHNLASFILATGRFWSKKEALEEEKRGLESKRNKEKHMEHMLTKD